MMTYREFLERKMPRAMESGFRPFYLPESLFPFQKDTVSWGVRRGRAALFEDCGLGKTVQQLSWAQQIVEKTSAPVLIMAPLAVGRQTVNEGARFGIDATLAEDGSQVSDAGIYVTNYEKLHRFDPSVFKGVALDESSILKAYDGKTRTLIIESFKSTPYRLACTATPAPNDYMELGNHSEFLGVMSRTEMLSTFFVHDGGDTSKWRLKGHAEDDFWKWLCSWAVNIRKPSDLGYEDGNFILPPLEITEHIVDAKIEQAGLLFPMEARTLDERRQSRSATVEDRCKKVADLVSASSEQWLVWCERNAESELLSKLIPDAVEVTGSDTDEDKVSRMMAFTDGTARVLISKPSIAGWGMNWQHCHNVAYAGISDSLESFYQSVRRCWRFGQKNPVQAHIVISNLDGAVLANLKRKQADVERMAAEMVRHMAKLSTAAIRGNARFKETYNPSMQMEIPSWLQKAA
jgi:hypothetical protein